METKEFEKTTNSLVTDCMKILDLARNDYTFDGDVLSNFKKGGEVLGLPSTEVLAVYLWKHVSSVLNYCNGKELIKEDIRGRIIDVINYLILLNALVEEANRRPSANNTSKS